MKELARRRGDTIVPAKAGAPGVEEEEVVTELLAFGLGEERFALPLAAVREILKVSPITEVPRSKPAVLGILAVRGRVTTVIDLRVRLKMPSTEPSRESRILLVEAEGETIGLLVDRVESVYRLGGDEVELAATVASDLSDHVVGVGRPGGLEEARPSELLVLLDPAPLLRSASW